MMQMPLHAYMASGRLNRARIFEAAAERDRDPLRFGGGKRASRQTGRRDLAAIASAV